MKKGLILLGLMVLACNHDPHHGADKGQKKSGQPMPPIVEDALLDQYLAQYAPYEMFFDASGLPEREKNLLKKLVAASKLIDEVYLQQTSRVGIAYRGRLHAQPDDPRHQKVLRLLRRNAMPYDQLQSFATFVGDIPYYEGHELYPRGMTASRFDAAHAALDAASQQEWMYPYTVIREDGQGGYRAVRYHQEYAETIDRIATLLREAAALAENESFKKYLEIKAGALLSDEYFEADVAWIDLQDNKYELVIGPFESYSDGIKGVKAKYESFVEVVDQEESRKLQIYTSHLQAMEENLPIPVEYRSKVGGLTAKFVIVQDIHRGGEAAAGYQAVAANLPNDPRVHAQKGTVKTFWKNMFRARFETIIKPVAERLVHQSQQPYLSSDGFFQFVLMHEICHALGPRTVKVGDKRGLPANAAIGPAYNALEEAKADIAGLVSLAYLMDQDVVDASREKEFYVSYLGSLFRSIRFGLAQAHGKAAALSLNYLVDRGSITYDQDSWRWSIRFENFREGVRDLAHDLLILLGDGDGRKVQDFFNQWTQMTPMLRDSLAKVGDLPIDVLPNYTIKWD